jgi:hypothetical protein
MKIWQPRCYSHGIITGDSPRLSSYPPSTPNDYYNNIELSEGARNSFSLGGLNVRVVMTEVLGSNLGAQRRLLIFFKVNSVSPDRWDRIN